MTGCGEIDPVTLEQLEELARSRPRSGREAQAKASAIRTLERLARNGRRPRLPPCPPGWYPPNQAAFEELDRALAATACRPMQQRVGASPIRAGRPAVARVRS